MTNSIPDTNQLLQLAKAGDRTDSERLFARHRSRLRSMVAMRLDPDVVARLDASDVVQEVFLEASRKLPDYVRRQPLPFYPWLRQIAWQRLVKLHEHHLQAKKRSTQREVRWDGGLPDDSVAILTQRLVSPEQTPSQIAVKEESRRRVRQALVAIGDQDRDILVMRFLEHLSVAEVAAILEISAGAVKTRQFRALARLRDVLAVEGDNHE